MSFKSKDIVAKVLERLDDGTVFSVIDDFLSGHCHEFAIALHRTLDYDLGLIKSTYKDKEGNQKKVLLHAFGIDDSGNGFDTEGRYDIQKAIQGYKTQEHPETGEILKNISFNKYKDEKSFKKKLWSIPVEDSWIKKGIKKISKDPLLYASGRNDKPSIKINQPKVFKFDEVLEMNEKFFPTYNPNLEMGFKNEFEKSFPNDKEEKLILNKIKKIKFEGKWKILDYLHLRWPYISDPGEKNKTKGTLAIYVGFDNIEKKLEFLNFKTKINNKLSLKESKGNFLKFMDNLGDFVIEKGPEFVQETMGKRKNLTKKGYIMDKKTIVKKALNKIEKLKEYQEKYKHVSPTDLKHTIEQEEDALKVLDEAWRESMKLHQKLGDLWLKYKGVMPELKDVYTTSGETNIAIRDCGRKYDKSFLKKGSSSGELLREFEKQEDEKTASGCGNLKCKCDPCECGDKCACGYEK